MQVRAYAPEDRAAVLDCVAALQEAERALDPRLPPGASMAARYLDELERSAARWAGQLLVATAPRVVGFASIFTRVPFATADDPPGTFALLGDLVVLPEARQRGVGRQLLAAAEAVARGAGATELRVELLAGNTAPAQLYRTAGFTPYLLTHRKLLGPHAP